MAERYDIVSQQSGYALGPVGAGQQLGPVMPQATALPPETPEPSLLKPILRQWWLVLLFMILGFAGAVTYIKLAQPLYVSQAKIYIPPTSSAVSDAIGVLERSNFLSTQVEVIRGTKVLSKAADTDGIRGLKTFLPANGNTVAYLKEELEVDLERKTDLIVVSLRSPYPEDAAKVVNAVVNAYRVHCQEAKDLQSNKLVSMLESQFKEESSRINEFETAIRDFKVRNPLVTLPSEGMSQERNNLQLVSASLTQAELKLIDARAVYGPDHVQVKRLTEQRDRYRELYEDALEKIKRSNSKGAELEEMMGRVATKKEFARQLADRLHQLEIAIGGRPMMEVEVYEPPRVADFPSYPRKNRAMAVALVCGALIGAGLALLRDRMDGRLRSVEEIQTVVGLPILGVVPAMTGRRTAVARAMTVHLDPRSVVAEAYRTIRTAVYFGTNGWHCKTILMTSPEPGDGKTTSASNLAIAIAQTGRTVLLLDADFRKPTQHKNLDIKDAIGLSSVLVGTEPLNRAIQHTGVEGLDILPCGPIPANPSEILNSREFGDLVDKLAQRYDHIIFDSPPINAVTDARILGAMCDATILVLRADKSTRKAGEHAKNALLSVGTRILGAIVNDAPRSKGYQVYGGSYYASADPSTAGPSRRLTAALPTDPEPKQSKQAPPRRDIA